MSTNNQDTTSCRTVSWIAAAVLGVLVAACMHWVYEYGVLMALVIGVIALVVLGWVFTKLFCSDSTQAGISAPAASAAQARAPTPTPAPTPTAAPAAEKPAPAPKPEPAPAPKPAPAAAKPAPAAASDEGGSKPAGLDSPRGGNADDLKQIKGVGPGLEKMLNGMGIWHFDQIAGWSAEEVAYMDANMPRFKGRASRDEWVKQASTLAAGGETEFAARVKKGDVYD